MASKGIDVRPRTCDERRVRVAFPDEPVGAASACGADVRHATTLHRAAVRFLLEMREAGMPELPPEIDTSKPHTARIYDYYLGRCVDVMQTP
jgi:hypothetical protein